MSEPMHGMQGRKTLVEEGTTFKGSLSSTCPIEVKGRVEGDVSAPALSVSASGSVHGKVKVGDMQSQGELAGEFDADTVQLSGSVKDRTIIRAKSLEVKLAPAEGKLQVVFGECQLEVGSEATRTEVVARGSEATNRSNEKAPKASIVPPEHAKTASAAAEPVKGSSVRPPTDANGA
jgi:cytoskeletal protein CcmA (bactofilin family)